jgi:hypothetical protein
MHLHGIIFAQYNDGILYPTARISKRIEWDPNDKNHNKEEFEAIKFAVESWMYMLFLTPFVIISDSKAILGILKKAASDSKAILDTDLENCQLRKDSNWSSETEQVSHQNFCWGKGTQHRM